MYNISREIKLDSKVPQIRLSNFEKIKIQFLATAFIILLGFVANGPWYISAGTGRGGVGKNTNNTDEHRMKSGMCEWERKYGVIANFTIRLPTTSDALNDQRKRLTTLEGFCSMVKNGSREFPKRGPQFIREIWMLPKHNFTYCHIGQFFFLPSLG